MAEKPYRILPHGAIEQLAPGLWSVRGDLPIPLHRNMIIYQLPEGGLLLHSVIAMNEAGMAALDALGKPAICVVPSSGHRMDAGFYRARYPKMKIVCPAGIRAKVEKVVPVGATCEEALPAMGVRLHGLGDMRDGELAYEVSVPGGKALLLCDAIGNADYAPGLLGSFFKNVTGGMRGRLAVPRIVRLFLVKDKAALRQALTNMAAIPDLRLVTVAHGHAVREACGEALREAAASL